MKRVPTVYFIFSAILGGIITVVIHDIYAKSKKNIPETQVIINQQTPDCEYKLSRLEGYKYIHPLLFISKDCEAPKFSGLKSGLNYFISEEKSFDPQSDISVYLCDLNREGDWMGINPEIGFTPGSLLKVVLLITHLKAAESNPDILTKKIKYEKKSALTPPTQHYNSKSIQIGHTYTVKELLKYMVAYSDNYATWLLNDYVDKNLLQKTFTDFGFAKPDLLDKRYKINTKDYSIFMRALYNAGYLSIESSEFALSLLTETDFNEGIVKGIPNTVIVAHKFGETGYLAEHQLHESAIVFLNNRPYLLTVMTKGSNVPHLAEEISKISNMVYTFMANDRS